LKIVSAKFHIKRAILEIGRAKFRQILISGAQFANFPIWQPVNFTHGAIENYFVPLVYSFLLSDKFCILKAL
jgi:hypothetical protein